MWNFRTDWKTNWLFPGERERKEKLIWEQIKYNYKFNKPLRDLRGLWSNFGLFSYLFPG